MNPAGGIMLNSVPNIREKFRHLLAISKMSIEEKIAYLGEMQILSPVDRSGVWCSIALRVARDHGRLPDHLHNRFLMEVGNEDLKRSYLELSDGVGPEGHREPEHPLP